MIENHDFMKNHFQHKNVKNLPSDSCVLFEFAACPGRPEGPREHFGAKSVKVAQKAKNDHAMHFWCKNVTLVQKGGNLHFFSF